MMNKLHLMILLLSFCTPLTSVSAVDDDERLWIYATFHQEASRFMMIDSEPRVIGLAQDLLDEDLLVLLEKELGQALPMSFILYQYSDGSYEIEPIGHLDSILLAAEHGDYQQDDFEGIQIMLFDGAFVEKVFSDGYPQIVTFYQEKSPAMLGLSVNNVDSANQLLKLDTLQTEQVSHIVADEALAGSGNCYPICPSVF